LTTGGSGSSFTLVSGDVLAPPAAPGMPGMGLLGTLELPPQPTSHANVISKASERRILSCSYSRTSK
jgi:hypothetical protein